MDATEQDKQFDMRFDKETFNYFKNQEKLVMQQKDKKKKKKKEQELEREKMTYKDIVIDYFKSIWQQTQ